MPIYTRSGDSGETDLLGGVRVPKDAAVLEVCGTLDELNSLIGLVRCEPMPPKLAASLEDIERRLFAVGSEFVAAGSGRSSGPLIGPDDVAAIERLIDEYDAGLTRPAGFILPGGSRAAALLHVARAVCRRAERRIISLAATSPQVGGSSALAYVNRLSDLLYIAARAANAAAGVADAPC